MSNTKTGIELIAIERNEQLTKHGRTVEEDAWGNDKFQLADAAAQLISKPDNINECVTPHGWDNEYFRKICFNKPYKQRLIIAGALIAAEIDRLQFEQ